jgi:SOS-response transcriptional repressor LexA
MSARKKYSKEFKLDAVSLVIDQNYTRVEASKNLGINANMLGRWVKEADTDEWYPCPSRHSKHTYALRVEGDSMTSTHGRSYPHGTIIYVDPEVQPTNGCNVIAKRASGNEATFKQYKIDSGYYYLIPLNPQYPTVEIDSTTRVCGVIIGSYLPE